jgi:hypothetical protein
MSIYIQLPGVATNSNLPIDYLDPAIDDYVSFLFDLAKVDSWPSLGSPTNGNTVFDRTFNDNDATVDINGGTISYAGKGFDFSGVSSWGNIRSTTDVLADIWTNGQEFLLATVVKLPTSGDWSDSTSNSSNIERALLNGGSGTFINSAANFGHIAQQNGGILQWTRQVTNGTTRVNKQLSNAQLTSI